jgi:septal ring factor EnvC (AmiA/AmiB activator)
MASRPPMLTILDSGSTQEFVRVRLLLDSTLPVIRSRTAALSAELEQGMRLQVSAETARAASIRSRQDLAERRRDFAALEEQALKLASRRGAEALGAGDVALASREQAGAIERQAERSRSARAIAADLAAMPAAPPRPGRTGGPAPAPPLLYRLPARAAVVDGFGSVSPAGIRSRGLLLATARGSEIRVPAAGIIRFSGPFRTYDGIVIIDHGKGWMSLITNISSKLEPGTGVTVGQPLGRALGRIGVELSRNGQHVSPALIAGSSQKLSNKAEQG